MKKATYLFGAAVAALTVHGSGRAGDVTTYVYDPLGRLYANWTSGGPNNGVVTGTNYDPAGNRSGYTVNGSSGTPPAAPPPPPPSPPGNQPPTAYSNLASVARCGTVTVNVLLNDTDPDGHVPLSLANVSYSGGRGVALMEGSTSITFQSSGVPGEAVVTYTVQDSLGAAANGTFTVNVNSTNQCE